MNYRKNFIPFFLIATFAIPLACPLTAPDLPKLQGGWMDAKKILRSLDCCVVTVSGLGSHLKVLQDWIDDEGPLDLDLRSRICTCQDSIHEDCLRLQRLVVDGNNKVAIIIIRPQSQLPWQSWHVVLLLWPMMDC